MTSLGRVGRILAGTIDVTNSIADSYSTNASIMDYSAANTSNVSCGMADASTDRKTKLMTNVSMHDSSTSSNDNTSNTSAMILQGNIFLCMYFFCLIYL